MSGDYGMTQQELLECDVARTSKALKAISGGGPMGLTPDNVKTSPEYRAAKRAYDTAFSRLRTFNSRSAK